ncbi:MAG TPA: MFS transporter [Acidimicrobiia bacterium]|nr:MFS transporter [Acidimicrobiia bacterium]
MAAATITTTGRESGRTGPVPADVSEPTGVRKWVPLGVLGLAIVIIVLDTTLLNVSLATIVRDLHTDIRSLQWVITAYSLTLAALTITGGRLGDLFGRKKLFVAGAVIFAAGSLLASLSKSVGMLIAGESIIEGVGAALMMPATSSLLVSTYRGKDRALALGVWGGMAAAGSAIGPIVGGYLTSHYSWRWGFRINVIVAAVLVLGSFLIKDSRDRTIRPTIDWTGIALSALGMIGFIYTVIEWSTHRMPLLGLGSLAVLAAFAVWERRVAAAGRTPLVSMSMFANTQFTTGTALTGAMSLGMIGLTFCLPVFLQSVRGLDALHTGIALLPMSMTMLVMAPLGGWLAGHIRPKRLVVFGEAVCVVGLVLLRQSLNVHTTAADLALPLAVYAVGLGLMMSQLGNITLSAVPVNQAGEASGVNSTVRQLGSSLGTAVIGSILIASIAGGLSGGVKSSPVVAPANRPVLAAQVKAQASAVEFGERLHTTVQLTPAEQAEIKHLSDEATVRADRIALLFTILFTGIGFLLAQKLPNSRDMERSGVPAAGH